MAILKVHKTLIGTDLLIGAIKRLQADYKADVKKISNDYYYSYFMITGEGIPPADEPIDIEFIEIVPLVFAIKVKLKIK